MVRNYQSKRMARTLATPAAGVRCTDRRTCIAIDAVVIGHQSSNTRRMSRLTVGFASYPLITLELGFHAIDVHAVLKRLAVARTRRVNLFAGSLHGAAPAATRGRRSSSGRRAGAPGARAAVGAGAAGAALPPQQPRATPPCAAQAAAAGATAAACDGECRRCAHAPVGDGARLTPWRWRWWGHARSAHALALHLGCAHGRAQLCGGSGRRQGRVCCSAGGGGGG